MAGVGGGKGNKSNAQQAQEFAAVWEGGAGPMTGSGLFMLRGSVAGLKRYGEASSQFVFLTYDADNTYKEKFDGEELQYLSQRDRG